MTEIGDSKTAASVTRELLDAGTDPLELVSRGMVPAMDEVGRLFECEEYFVPELLLSARATKAALEFIRPLLAARGEQPVGRVIIGTVKGDLHDIGKNLVASLLEGGSFEVTDLGADVSPERFIAAVKKTAPVTRDYAHQIGADAYGESATAAVSMARELMGVVHA